LKEHTRYDERHESNAGPDADSSAASDTKSDARTGDAGGADGIIPARLYAAHEIPALAGVSCVAFVPGAPGITAGIRCPHSYAPCLRNPDIRDSIDGKHMNAEPLGGNKKELAGLKNKKVLIVEDDQFLRYLLSVKMGQLQDRGVQVFSSGDTEEALETAKKVRPDVIFLDLVMPGMNGYEFLKELRKEPQFKETPVIILSNLTNQDNGERAKNLNVSAYLVKADFALNDLMEKVSDVLLNARPEPVTA